MKQHTASFRFESPHAERLYRVLQPEIEDSVGGSRSSAMVSLEEGVLLLQVEAMDISALRAALNMWLRLVNVADEMQEAAMLCRVKRESISE